MLKEENYSLLAGLEIELREVSAQKDRYRQSYNVLHKENKLLQSELAILKEKNSLLGKTVIYTTFSTFVLFMLATWLFLKIT